jgi:phosphate starvation-inducible PhoH-like protein
MELTIQAASHEEAMVLYGFGDRNLKLLRDAFDVQITGRGTTLRLLGEQDPVEKVAALLNGLISLIRSTEKVPPDYLAKKIDRVLSADNSRVRSGMATTAGSKGAETNLPTSPPTSADIPGEESEDSIEGLSRSPGQDTYINSILNNEIVFCIGPAGTGKTYLAVRMAARLLRKGVIRKIFLCRPAVEAGEKLGFLPGDFQAKINPYLRPLYDALNDILDYETVKRFLEREIIEILPLAYMRGRTLNNAFIILDEGQNTSVLQMKMFLTRMGMSSRIVVNGDITQVDLPEGMESGLINAQKIIRGIRGISWVELGKLDIVRHPLVRKIVEAYEGAEQDL